MIAPMLAAPMSKADVSNWNDWMMEEKFDGHRLVVQVTAHGEVTAYTRERKHVGAAGKTQLTRDLPPHLIAGFRKLAPHTGELVLDGELLATMRDGRFGTSTDVTRTELQSTLSFVAFDVLTTSVGSCMMLTYTERRRLLESLFAGRLIANVIIAEVRECIDTDAVSAFTHEVWDRGGEGLILKNKKARYTEGERGRRTCAFVKIKKLLTDVLTVVGFEATRGTVMNRGRFATVVLENAKGERTSVKTKDDAELNAFEQAARLGWQPGMAHPALGRKLRIEYQDVAADGGYRHPRWDRWEDE